MKHGTEFFLGQRSQTLQRRGKAKGREDGIARYRGPLVPGTDVLADVAAEDMPAGGAALRFGNAAAQFDGEVGNAQPRIHREAGFRGEPGFRNRHNRRRGTRLDTSRTSAAPVRRRGCGRLNLQRHQQFAQKKPGPALLVDQASILPDPPQPRHAGIRTFQQRRSIHANPGLELGSDVLPQPVAQPFQAAPNHVVIIAAPGIARDPGAAVAVEFRGIRPRSIVEFADAD